MKQYEDNYPSGFPLVLSKKERKKITDYYLDTVKGEFLHEYPEPDDDEEMYWAGVKIGKRMFDLCVYWMSEEIICIVYECDFVNDCWRTNTRHEWVLTDSMDNLKQTYCIKDKANGSIYPEMQLKDILEEINRDRSEEWINYDESDWREGLEQFTTLEVVEGKRQ